MIPDWTLEVLSPEQKPNKVIGNILYCLQQGGLLGWFIDSDDFSILGFQLGQQPELFQEGDRLPILAGVNLELTVEQVLSWLKIENT